MVGDSFGGYRIVSRLGQGRSGTVYRAQRESDGGYFALKIVHPEMTKDTARRAELLEAAGLAGRLSHPSLARIVEVLEHAATIGIVSELVEGQTLADRLRSGPLPGAEVTRIATALALAVAHAHEHGVCGLALDAHNVQLTAGGAPIWIGLDTLAGPRETSHEQLILADIGDLVLLVRRMARGSTDLPDGLLAALAAQDAASAAGDHGPYRTARDLAQDIAEPPGAAGARWRRWMVAAAAVLLPAALVLALAVGRADTVKEPQPGVIAVLPFETVSPTAESFYLGVGLADAITTQLARARLLTVRPMSAVMEATLDRPELDMAARRLGAGAILTGDCLQSGGVVRARVRLIDSVTGADVWERDFESGDEGQEPIDEQIARQALESLVPGSAGRPRVPHATEAGDPKLASYLTLLARGRMADYETRTLKEAVHLLERATTTAPGFEPAYAALAEASTNMFLGGLSPDRSWLARGIAAGRRAVELEPDDPKAHFSLGYALLFSGEPVQAVQEVLAALRLDPRHTESLRLMSALLSQAGAARPARALRDRAADLAPSMAPGWGDVYLAAAEGRMTETVQMLEQEIVTRRAAGRPTEIPVQTLGFLAFETNDATAGLRWAAMLEELSDNAAYSDLVRLLALARMGDASAVRSILSKGRDAYWHDWEYSLWIARALALVGDRKASLDWLSRSADLGGYDASALKRGGFFTELGDDPAFRRAEFAVNSRARQIVDLAASAGFL